MEDWKKLWYKVRRKYSDSKAFSELRGIVLKRDGNVCQTCGSNEVLACHHRSYKHYIEGGEAEAADCITLCKRCHMGIHKNGNTMKRFAAEQQEWLEKHVKEAEEYVTPVHKETTPKKPIVLDQDGKRVRSEEEKAWLRWYWWNKKRK